MSRTRWVAFVAAAAALCLGLAPDARADGHEVKVGVILGFTGPIESLTPAMADSAELALKEASDSGAFLGGKVLVPVRGDSTCIDAAAATAAAERLVTAEGVAAIFGADCSGVTIGDHQQRLGAERRRHHLAVRDLAGAHHDRGQRPLLPHRAVGCAGRGRCWPSILIETRHRQCRGHLHQQRLRQGPRRQLRRRTFAALGGTVEISAAHEDGKGDYSAEVGALAASGAEHLVVFGYVDQGGKGIIQTSVDTGAFENFIVADGMIGDSLIEAIGDALDRHHRHGCRARPPRAPAMFLDHAAANGVDGDGPFRGESYDAAALDRARHAGGGLGRPGRESQAHDDGGRQRARASRFFRASWPRGCRSWPRAARSTMSARPPSSSPTWARSAGYLRR